MGRDREVVHEVGVPTAERPSTNPLRGIAKAGKVARFP